MSEEDPTVTNLKAAVIAGREFLEEVPPAPIDETFNAINSRSNHDADAFFDLAAYLVAVTNPAEDKSFPNLKDMCDRAKQNTEEALPFLAAGEGTGNDNARTMVGGAYVAEQMASEMAPIAARMAELAEKAKEAAVTLQQAMIGLAKAEAQFAQPADSYTAAHGAAMEGSGNFLIDLG